MNVIDSVFGTTLLVGGCGFTGYHIINDLIRTNAVIVPNEIHVFDINVDADRPHYSHVVPPSNYHRGDISDSDRVKEVVKKVNPVVIFDLVTPPAFKHDLSHYMRINVEARKHLLQILHAQGACKALVYSSSAGVVHDSHSNLLFATEDLPVLYMPEQSEPYSHSKAVAETMVLQSNFNGTGTARFLTAAIRLCSPFGAGHGKTTNVIIENARQGKYRFQVGNGKNLSDWVYIENAARAFLLAAQALLRAHEALPIRPPMGERVDGEAFFISNDEPIPFWDFARKLGASAGYVTDTQAIKVIPRWVGMIMAFASEWITWLISLGTKQATFTQHGVRYSTITRFHNIDKAKQRLKYQPFISLEEGIRGSGQPVLLKKAHTED